MGCKLASPSTLSNTMPPKPACADQVVLGRYRMRMADEDFKGEGANSMCRKGMDNSTGKDVAIKLYKDKQDGTSSKQMLVSFKKQIYVLKKLLEPFPTTITDPCLWHERLNNIQPEQVFVVLIDYSKNSVGEPDFDLKDDKLYVITELADQSLEDVISCHRDAQRPLSKDFIQNASCSIILAMASLHAKGFVHLDMKPENLLFFGGRLKVIDVEGCVLAYSQIRINDPTIAFSACYCAPEWAKFLIAETEVQLRASPLLDAWSVGATICELVTLRPIFQPMYYKFCRDADSHREATFLLMEWLSSSLHKFELPSSVAQFDPEFVKVLEQGLLLCNPSQRKTCAECISFDYISAAKDMIVDAPAAPTYGERGRPEDDSTSAPLHKGCLWKLKTNGNLEDPVAWIKRDMWIAGNHNLCYFSQREQHRLVLLFRDKLRTAKFNTTSASSAKSNVVQILYQDERVCTNHKSIYLAADSPEELAEWVKKLKMAARKMKQTKTMRLGQTMHEELKAFRIAVKNRRISIEENRKDQFEPIFKGSLWKVKGEGNETQEKDWVMREMWVAKNGALTYYSVKEDRNLVYYTSEDLKLAKVTYVPDGTTCKTFAFCIQLPPVNGVKFAPGIFAAESAATRDRWMAELKKKAPARGRGSNSRCFLWMCVARLCASQLA